MNSQKILELSKDVVEITSKLAKELKREGLGRVQHIIRGNSENPYKPDQPIADTVLQLAEHFFLGTGVSKATLLIPKPLLYGLKGELCRFGIKEGDEINTPYGLLYVEENPVRLSVIPYGINSK